MREGRSFKNETFYIKVLKNKEHKIRIGVGVGQKITKKAASRNYYKRLLRHISKEVFTDFKLSYDVVLILHSFKGEKFEILKKNAEDILQKAGLRI